MHQPEYHGSATIAPSPYEDEVSVLLREDGTAAVEYGDAFNRLVYRRDYAYRDVIAKAVKRVEYPKFSHWSTLSGSYDPVILNAVWCRKATYRITQRYRVGRNGVLKSIEGPDEHDQG